MADFVVVGLDYTSGDDTLWGIWLEDDPPVVEFGPIYLQEYGADEEIIELFGKRLGMKILKAYEDGDLVKIKGKKALEVLRAIDDYMREEYGVETNFEKRAAQMVVYKMRI
jgi:hypothetical protein